MKSLFYSQIETKLYRLRHFKRINFIFNNEKIKEFRTKVLDHPKKKKKGKKHLFYRFAGTNKHSKIS